MTNLARSVWPATTSSGQRHQRDARRDQQPQQRLRRDADRSRRRLTPATTRAVVETPPRRPPFRGFQHDIRRTVDAENPRFTGATGELSAVSLRHVAGVLEVVADEEAITLPHGALAAVISRYGASFDPEASISVVATLHAQSNDCTLRHVRHLAGYDVIARDYLVYEAAGRIRCARWQRQSRRRSSTSRLP